jgi:hypothetical protein
MRKHPSDWVSSRKPIEVQVAAVVCVIIALATGKAVSTTFKALCPTYAEQVKMDKTEFCQTHYNNFMKTGTVSDKRRSGRPPKLPHSVALEASKILKAGTTIKAYPKADAKRMIDVHVLWTSIDLACAECREV